MSPVVKLTQLDCMYQANDLKGEGDSEIVETNTVRH